MCIIAEDVFLCLIILLGVIYSTTDASINNYRSIDRVKRQSSTGTGGCESLKQLVSEEEFCYKDDLQVPCPIYAEIGEVIVRKCRSFYSKDGLTNTSYICETNGWTSIDRPCQAECGLKGTGGTPLIIGGEVAEESEYPWAVKIYYKGKIICSGTIISPSDVLTVLGQLHATTTSNPTPLEDVITRSTPQLVSKKECGSLKQTVSEEDQCYILGVAEDCPKSSEAGILIEKRCRAFYNRGGVTNTTYVCKDGEWISMGRTCQPRCGRDKPRITIWDSDDHETDQNQYPWVVAMYMTEETMFICSGSIISPYHVLTAARCFTNGKGKLNGGKEQYIISAGRFQGVNGSDEYPQRRKIRNIFVHANYEGETTDHLNDIAIVEVDEAFVLTPGVQPVCIDWNSIYEVSDFQDGSRGEVSGWSYKTSREPAHHEDYYHTLRRDFITYKPNNVCTEVFTEYQEQHSLDNRFCTANVPEASCSANIGSGLSFRSDGTKFFLRGIHSFVRGCQKYDTTTPYIVYTKVSGYLAWLKAQMERNPSFQMEYSTTTEDQNGCILPEHVQYGQFKMSAVNSAYVQKKLVLSSTTISLHCTDTTNEAVETFFCVENVWQPSIERATCKKPGTCVSIETTISEEVSCRLNRKSVSCSNPENNTVAVVRCQPYYTFAGHLPIYKCQNGKWDQKFLPCQPECGLKRVETETLIIGGNETITNEYPWVVAVYDASREQRCGGTIISRLFVLSAAHCFANSDGKPRNKDNYLIVAGKYYRNISAYEPNSQQRKVKTLYIHEDYKGKIQKFRDDIALLELSEPFVLSLEIQPICVDWDTLYEEFDFINGNKGVVVGWGYTSEEGFPSDVQKKLLAPYRSRLDCLQHLPEEYTQQYLSTDKICAGYVRNNTNICDGDSGGGLFFKSDGEKFYIRGIASLTVKSKVGCNPNHYALYTKVSEYLSWIETRTRKVL